MNPADASPRRHTIYDRWRHEEMLVAAAGGPAAASKLSRPATKEELELIKKLVASIESKKPQTPPFHSQ